MTDQVLTRTEICIKNVWMSVLNIVDISPDQSFFELGGDSLLMLDMISQLNGELNIEIDPTLLFEDASLRGLARLIDASQSGDTSAREGVV